MATNCSATLAGLPRDCGTSMGGVKRVLIANFADVKTRTATAGKVDTITMETGKRFFEYYVRGDVSSMTTTGTIDQSSGINFQTTALLLQFNRMTTEKRTEMAALLLNDMVVIVEDRNGVFWYLGYDEPVTASASEGGTGAARADANRYSVTLTDNSRELPFEVDGKVITALLTPAA